MGPVGVSHWRHMLWVEADVLWRASWSSRIWHQPGCKQVGQTPSVNNSLSKQWALPQVYDHHEVDTFKRFLCPFWSLTVFCSGELRSKRGIGDVTGDACVSWLCGTAALHCDRVKQPRPVLSHAQRHQLSVSIFLCNCWLMDVCTASHFFSELVISSLL